MLIGCLDEIIVFVIQCRYHCVEEKQKSQSKVVCIIVGKVVFGKSRIESDSEELTKMLMLIEQGSEVLTFVIQCRYHCVYNKENSQYKVVCIKIDKVVFDKNAIESDSEELVKILMLIGHGGEICTFVIQCRYHWVEEKETHKNSIICGTVDKIVLVKVKLQVIFE